MATTPQAVGYSGTPLPKKLGFKDGQAALFLNLPADLAWLMTSVNFGWVRGDGRIRGEPKGNPVLGQALSDMSDGPVARLKTEKFDVVHAFFTKAVVLETAARKFASMIKPDGMVWVSWPKKAAKVATDITEDEIRRIVLPIGLVDVKVCAVSDVWSGLKLVIRKELRPK